MKQYRIAALVLFVTSLWLPAYAHHIAVVVQQQNPTESLTSPELAKIFKSETRKWPNGADVRVVLNRNSAAAFQVLERLAHMPAPTAKTFIAKHKNFFLLANSNAEVLRLVSSNRGALGLVDVRAVDSTIKVVKVDGKLPLQKAYLPD
ncbi:MAG TPA: substrate-binding domain-containing protein [Candidatus Angelobacter sp.]|nr:substrate-binding domain-containing protein [Candidatus Angelobacter sp.]